jgi:hypothetical protein
MTELGAFINVSEKGWLFTLGMLAGFFLDIDHIFFLMLETIDTALFCRDIKYGMPGAVLMLATSMNHVDHIFLFMLETIDTAHFD